jgi:hypothetical protein
VDAEELAELLAGLTGTEVGRADDAVVVVTDDSRTGWVIEVAAYAHGWEVATRGASRIRLRPVAP